jgi:hypothetical protein
MIHPFFYSEEDINLAKLWLQVSLNGCDQLSQIIELHLLQELYSICLLFQLLLRKVNLNDVLAKVFKMKQLHEL